jgi:hypothetical protein
MGKYIRRLKLILKVSSHMPYLAHFLQTVFQHKNYSDSRTVRPSDMLTLVRPKLALKDVKSWPEWQFGEHAALIEIENYPSTKTLGEDWDVLVKWQKDCNALQNVKLAFELKDCLGERERRVFEILPRLMKTYLHAERIEVIVNHKRLSPKHEWCDRRCIELIKRVFTKIIDEAFWRTTCGL